MALPLRIFHCLIVLAVIIAWVTAESDGLWLEWHVHIGIFIFSLLVFRVLWGLIESKYFSFRDCSSPAKISMVEHGRLAAVSKLILLGLMLMQASIGLFLTDDEADIHGPLYFLTDSIWSDWLTYLHYEIFNILIVMISMHLLAISYYMIVKRKNLFRLMIFGSLDENVELDDRRRGGRNKINIILAAGFACVVFWCIESGALLR